MSKSKKYKKHQVAWKNDREENIPDGWHIHHLDNNHSNNNPDNLICVTREMHRDIHQIMYDRYGNTKDYFSAKLLGGVNSKHPGGCPQAGWNKGKPAPWSKFSNKGNATPVLDLENGIYYDSLSEAARSVNKSVQRVRQLMKLQNKPISIKRPNTIRKKSRFIYV
tara:strand:- start:71 stop:565 length:495 start_codon:yes stop_codon:yes gene_type:complete